MTTTRKLLVSVAVLGAAAAVAGLGTFGTFTSTTSASQEVSSGTVEIMLGARGPTTACPSPPPGWSPATPCSARSSSPTPAPRTSPRSS